LLLEQRKQAVVARPRRIERWLVRWFVRIMASADCYRQASRWLRRLPRPPIPGWTRWRTMPRPAPKTFRERWTSSHK